MRANHNLALQEHARPEYETFMARAETIRWSPNSIDYSKIDHSKLTINDVFAVFVTLHIENYSDVYTKSLIEVYRDVPLIQKFVLNWEREEENHARVLEKYMVSLGLSLEELRSNYAKVNKEDFPFPSQNQTGMNIFAFVQELMTREMYTKILKTTKEPVLIEILKRVVRDEERHFRFYKHVLNLRMQLDKKDTLKQMRQIIRIFGMPQTMYRQQAMTDQLMIYFPFNLNELKAISGPIMKILEASPSRWLNRFPRLQKFWQMRRTLVYAPMSPYMWGHISIIVKRALGLNSVPQADKDYVESMIKRLEQLLVKAPVQQPLNSVAHL